MLMLDTNICIYVLKEHPVSVLKFFEAAESLHISSIVYAELWSGIEQSPEKRKAARAEELHQFLSFFTVHGWDTRAAKEYAKQFSCLKKQGIMIGNMDLLIASHAKSLNATLVTNNIREFQRIKGLKLENWV